MGSSASRGTSYRQQREAKPMKTKASLAASFVLLAAGAWASTPAQRAVEGWPQPNKQAAQAMIDKYGQPDSTIGDRLERDHRGPFKRVAVDGRAGADAIVENTVDYPVASASGGMGLLCLDGAVVRPDIDAAELSACSASESSNILALNTADGVMRGRTSADDARTQQARTLRLRSAGKSSPDAERLQFRPGVDPLWDWVHTAPY